MSDDKQLRARDWLVRPVALQTAQRMVRQFHYARGGSNTAVACYGLFRKSAAFWDRDCMGVTWWLPPTRTAAVSVAPDAPDRVLALTRMVIHPDAPRNAATFLLARSIKALPPQYKHLVTYADEWQGHTGTVYRAANWRYEGTTRPSWVYVRGGVQRSCKVADRTYSHDEMVAAGYEALGPYPKHKFTYTRVS